MRTKWEAFHLREFDWDWGADDVEAFDELGENEDNVQVYCLRQCRSIPAFRTSIFWCKPAEC